LRVSERRWDMADSLESAVAAHYARHGLAEAIFAAVKAGGGDLDNLTVEDLAPVDEFHTAGRKATLKALHLTPLKPGMRLLDAGSGIGGTARCIASERDCHVTGVDLTPDYVEVAKMLTERVGLSGLCDFHVGSVLDLPFADKSFDGAVTFHVAMNIADREKFYAELARVVRPGGPLCIFDVMKGPAEGMLYPVPWAETEMTSFLKSRDETAALIEAAGFSLANEQNLREFARAFFREMLSKVKKEGAPPRLGLRLLTGLNTEKKFANYAEALEAHQIEPVILVAKRR